MMQYYQEVAVQELLTASEVARFLRVSPFAVRTWARTGRLPAVRLSPRVIRFRRADVRAAVGLPAATGQDGGSELK
jgi:excisionase family DNA binding protein